MVNKVEYLRMAIFFGKISIKFCRNFNLGHTINVQVIYCLKTVNMSQAGSIKTNTMFKVSLCRCMTSSEKLKKKYFCIW